MQVRRPLSSQAGHIPNHFELGYGAARPADLPSPGVSWAAIKDGNWSVLDGFVGLFTANGVRPWYDIGGGFSGMVPDLTLWTTRMGQLAERYGSRIDYGLGNEWDAGSFWPGTQEQAFTYMKAASDAIRAVLPNARIGSNSTTAPGHDFLDAFLSDDGADYITDVCGHFYVQGREPEEMLPLILAYRRVMEAHGVDNLPLRCTENGWHQWYNNGSPVNDQWTPAPETDVQLPDALAADYIVRAHLSALLSRLRMYVHWGPDEFAFSQLDLLNRDNAALLDPAGDAYAYMTAQLSGARLRKSRSRGLMFIDFTKNGQSGRIYWRRDGESGNVDLSGYSSGTDVYGDPISLSASYNVTSSPIYVFE